jgi:prophage antirepressor-like protein
MENVIQIFRNEVFGEIRTLTNEKGETFFVGKDVAKALGYCNSRDALSKHVDDEDRLVSQIATSGQNRSIIVINESGLYSLILSSKLEQARAFKRWVTSEVLPAIRKTGHYEMTSAELKQLAATAEYAEEVLLSVDCLTTTQVAKELSMTGPELYRQLIKWGVIYWQSGEYMLYADYARMNLTKTRTISLRNRLGICHCHRYLVWTEEGRLFIHEKYRQEQAFESKLDRIEFC